jgi:hypothetical protein
MSVCMRLSLSLSLCLSVCVCHSVYAPLCVFAGSAGSARIDEMEDVAAGNKLSKSSTR